MMRERPVGTVWLEETNNGVVLHMRVGTGADVMLTLPNASVADKRKRNSLGSCRGDNAVSAGRERDHVWRHVVGGLHARNGEPR